MTQIAIRVRPGLIKVEVCAETYISGMNNWFCGYSKDYLQAKQKVNV